nr:MAG: hypothetical protein 3 [Leviviridae sp.]
MDFHPTLCFQLLQDQLPYKLPHINDSLSVKEAASAALLSSFLKKWLPPDPKPLDAVAKQMFLNCNARCSSVTFDIENPLYSILVRAKSLLHESFLSGYLQENCLTLHAAMQHGRMGPGASIGTKHTDFYHKMFSAELTFTKEGLYKFYQGGLSSTWLEAEITRHENYGEQVVSGSKLSTVPKNCKTNRTICTEPSLNMFFQLGAGRIIEGLLLKRHNIDLSTQPDVNRDFALRGSIDGSFATIDLSSASDTISLPLVEFLLPRSTVAVLKLMRSEYTVVDGVEVKLEMMSSMGNGFTFPLQTIIFATLVRASYEFLGIIPKAFGENRNYAVFGDDIICTREAYECVCAVLGMAGFLVNDEKSFNLGAFRESCGRDYFRGTDVRGVYLRKVENEQDVYSIFNRLARWSIKHCIDISRCLLYLKGLVKFQPVPFDASDTEGIKCPTSHLTHSKFDRNGARYYWASVAKAKRVSVSPTELQYNPAGALIAHVGGYLREHQYTLRSNKVFWKVVKKKTPSWDHLQDAELTTRGYEDLFQYLALLTSGLVTQTAVDPRLIQWELVNFTSS